VTIKPLTTGVLAATVIGAAAAGVTSVAPVGPTAPPVQLVVFGASPPPDPADAAPAPGVSFASKGNLVEDGIGHSGASPLGLANIRVAGAGAATADITAAGPKLTPTFRMSRASAKAPPQEADPGA